eukprot:scaffold1316_cov130-Isochrysis_galbana.AAC.10
MGRPPPPGRYLRGCAVLGRPGAKAAHRFPGYGRAAVPTHPSHLQGAGRGPQKPKRGRRRRAGASRESPRAAVGGSRRSMTWCRAGTSRLGRGPRRLGRRRREALQRSMR